MEDGLFGQPSRGVCNDNARLFTRSEHCIQAAAN
jgi:hypothetical protein